MSEVLQSQEVIKLYENQYIKPDLSDDDILEHFGVKGMKWGIRKAKKKIFGSKLKRKNKGSKEKNKKPKYASNKEAMDAQDLAYIKKNKSQFSTKELNEVMNRITAEQRLSQMAKEQKRNKSKFRRVIHSKAFKVVAFASLSALSYASVNALMTDKSNRSGKQFAKDLGKGAAVGALGALPVPDQTKNDVKRLVGQHNKKKKG